MTYTFETLRQVNSSRCLRWHKSGLDEWSLADWVVAVGGEVGEALNVVKKLNRDRDGQPGNTRSRIELLSDLADELADIVIYLDILVSAAGGERLGILFDRKDFAELRQATRFEYPDATILSVSEWAAGMLELAGGLACVVLVNSGHVGSAADELLNAIDASAHAWEIDLGLAVARKFNATSERYGFPERLTA
ncbi:MAG TPA: MazG-like family protein [Pseudorhizobium sp.]|jgi:NTP pyrophosphatase (non-canonical NTP hydrolase)|nr:MazG-like family protein [Pseudorhizobium sp.]